MAEARVLGLSTQCGAHLGDPSYLIRGIGDRSSRWIGDGGEDVIVVVSVLGCVKDTVYGLFFFVQIPMGIVVEGVRTTGISPSRKSSYSIGDRG